VKGERIVVKGSLFIICLEMNDFYYNLNIVFKIIIHNYLSSMIVLYI